MTFEFFVRRGCCCRYSTGFTSVHGETPSADYARMRRESLESKFGHALGTYSSKSFNAIYRFGPFLALYRAAIISFHVLRLAMWQLFVQDMKKRAVKVNMNFSQCFSYCFADTLGNEHTLRLGCGKRFGPLGLLCI